VETLNADLDSICTRIFGYYRARVDRRDHGTGAHDRRAEFLTAETAERIRRLYRADFEALGYTPPDV
jgi:hypothetical protein